MSDIQPGPCIICGLRDYSLSFGGPTICPSCDCGHTGQHKVRMQAERIMDLEREVLELTAKFDQAAKAARPEALRIPEVLERFRFMLEYIAKDKVSDDVFLAVSVHEKSPATEHLRLAPTVGDLKDLLALADHHAACKAVSGCRGSGEYAEQIFTCEECGDVTESMQCPRGRSRTIPSPRGTK